MSQNKKEQLNKTSEERDERGRIIICDASQIPENMTEDEAVEFWDKHAMSEALLDTSFIAEEDESDLPPPRKGNKKGRTK